MPARLSKAAVRAESKPTNGRNQRSNELAVHEETKGTNAALNGGRGVSALPGQARVDAFMQGTTVSRRAFSPRDRVSFCVRKSPVFGQNKALSSRPKGAASSAREER